MRYGKTNNQRYEEEKAAQKAERIERETWRKRFALFPVTMTDGTQVWLEKYWFREHYIEIKDFSLRLWPGFWTTRKETIK